MRSPRPAPLHFPITIRRIVRLLWQMPLVAAMLCGAGMGVLFLRSDVRSFRPRLPQIRKMIEVQKAATPVLPPFLIQCLHAEGFPDQHTAGCLLSQYGLDDTTSLHRQARRLLWTGSLYWHLSGEERDMLYCAFMNDGAGRKGIHHLASRLFGRPVERLTDSELAALAVASRSPTRFLRDRALLETFAEKLLVKSSSGRLYFDKLEMD